MSKPPFDNPKYARNPTHQEPPKDTVPVTKKTASNPTYLRCTSNEDIGKGGTVPMRRNDAKS
jgi:hypothetical protein